MDHTFLIRQLSGNAGRIERLVSGFSDDEARWKPDENTWSLLEVVNHLLDEEREDFRVRLNIILHHPKKEWPAIDPAGWVTARQYNQRRLDQSLAEFLEERTSSLNWLSGLEGPDWEIEYSSPFGVMKAGEMFASWVTHDHLHMRQIVEIYRSLAEQKSAPYSLNYAGDW
jgi:hypothetical protein